MIPLNYEINRCHDEVLKCEWVQIKELAHNKEATPLTQLTSQLLLQAMVKGFMDFDIGAHEVEMNIPEHATSKSYKLFCSAHFTNMKL